jgi:TPP-dependent pyruvate/acetoin dehydrogenase alpha subunit
MIEFQPKLLLQLYRTMLLIRRFEETAMELKARQIIPGLLHLYIGEEAVATGVCAALRQDDYISSTHRGHGHCIAKGGDISLMMAELLGREKGYCRGKGGSMHIADIDLGILGANGIVSAGMPMAFPSRCAERIKWWPVFLEMADRTREPFMRASIWRLFGSCR